MRSSRAALLAALLAAPTLLDCSLMGLDDFGPHGCQTDDDCLLAQKALGDAERCELYVCEQGSCVPRRSTETCNGKDDDCDELIDDGLILKPHEIPGSTGTALPDAFVAYARPSSTSRDAFVVSGDGMGDARGLWVRGADRDEPTTLSFASAAVNPSEPNWHCPSRTVSAGVAVSYCTMNAVAVGADEENLVFAVINTWGCAHGQLRVGLATASDPFRIWLGSSAVGQEPESNIEVGVDVGSSDGRCSGHSVPDEPQQAVGARSPSVAVLEAYPGGAGALVSWLAARFDLRAASCESTVDVPVQALGVMVPEEARGASQRWLVGSDDGLPATIGRSSSLLPPAVLSLGVEGDAGRYLVAFPSHQDDATGVALVLVTVKGAHLSLSEAEPSFIPDDHADFVGLGHGENPGELAVAWRSGCGAKSQLKLAPVTIEGSSREISEPLPLATGNIVSAPRLLHASDGFRARGKRGGWYVAWSEQLQPGVGRSRLARVSDAPSPTPAEVFTVTSGPVGFPLLFPGEDTPIHQGLVTVTTTGTSIDPFFEPWCQ